MKKYIFIITLLASILNVNAQQNAELQQLINESFTFNPKLKEIQQNEQIAQQRIAVTKSNQMPNVSGLVSYNYIDPVGQATFPVGPGVTRNLQFQPNNNFNANITANYILLDFGRLKSAVEKSKEDLNLSKQNTEYNKQILASQVAGIYYYIVYLKKAVSIQDSVINYYKQNKSIIQSKLNNGDALKVDLFNIEASIDNEQNRKVDLQNLLQKQLNLLEFTTGKSMVQLSQFDFVIKNGSVDDYIKLAENQNSEYALVKTRITQAQLDVKYNKRQLTPTLNATASAGFRNGYQPDIFENRFNYLAGLSLNVPIYTGGKNKSQIEVAQQMLKQTEYSMQSLNNLYRKDIKQAITDMESNNERLKNAESQIKSATEVLSLTQSRYRNGVATYLDITYAANGIQRAALNKLQFEYQLCIAKIELAKLTGEKYW
ncbi:MAG: TolC family protein [Candidatus Methylacidiphilales bacterium]